MCLLSQLAPGHWLLPRSGCSSTMHLPALFAPWVPLFQLFKSSMPLGQFSPAHIIHTFISISQHIFFLNCFYSKHFVVTINIKISMIEFTKFWSWSAKMVYVQKPYLSQRADKIVPSTLGCSTLKKNIQPSNETEPVFLNVYGAQESILRHQFHQPM